jgi:signal transduction histidine kinase
MDPFMSFPKRLWPGWLAIGVFVSVVMLAWLGYRAISEWQRSAKLLAQRRADAAVDLLVTAITRDMRAVQASVLSSPRFDELRAGLIPDLNGVGSAFARYPYPEAFFAGSGRPGPDSVMFYSRVERPPAWRTRSDGQNRFPVVLGPEPAMSRLLFDRIAKDAAKGRRFATFGTTLNGGAYQIVALLSYEEPRRERLDAIFGFIVNLDWVRQHYFSELAAQVMSIQGTDAGLTLAILDAAGTSVVGDRTAATGAPSSRRQFPMLFFDPSLVALDPPADLDRHDWTARATVSGDRALVAAQVGARWALGIAAISAVVLAVGFLLTVQAARANARLVTMRSDFVSAVTHELKTPIATIRAISETLASGRSSNPEMSREYAQLAVHEAKRLTRLIDNLLAYARITDVTEAYSFEPVAVATIAQQSLKEFGSQLAAAGFSVNVDIPPDLPAVRADRTSMVLAVGNLVDNAIRYSNVTRKLTIGAHASNGSVVVVVTDAGSGIPASEIEHVTRKFFRGNGAISGGSGLGLSIAQRIVCDHTGSMVIRSEVGVGTTVSITLPTAPVEDEEANTNR